MATERAANGEIPVEALLAQLRRAAEQDGVEDVDAVVAEFATFVRAQAPRIAAQRAGRRSGMSWSSALLSAGALSVAVFGAVASGLVTNPFLPSTPSYAGATDRDATDRAGGIDGDVLVVSPGGVTSDGAGSAPGPANDAAATDPFVEPAPATEFAETTPMTFTDPDALALLAEQRSAGPTPPPSTTPVAPSTTAPDAPGAAVDPADAATTAATPTTPTTAPAGSAPDATTTTVLAPVLDASTGPESLVTPAPQDQQIQQIQQNQANTDQGGAG